MTIKNENEVQSLDDEFNLTYDELYHALESLYDEFKKLGSRYNTLKKNYACLLIEKKKSLKKKACIVIDDNHKLIQLESENKSLKEKVEKLTTILTKFT
jgi:hypothetical protein